MRFEAKAAIAIGILLPVLETYRRGIGYWGVDFTTMFEDYLGGALLLAAAWAAHRRTSFHAPLLLTAWASVTGMMTLSFIGQVEETIRGVDLEPMNTDVLVVKLILLVICAVALFRSFQLCKTGADRPSS